MEEVRVEYGSGLSGKQTIEVQDEVIPQEAEFRVVQQAVVSTQPLGGKVSKILKRIVSKVARDFRSSSVYSLSNQGSGEKRQKYRS